MRTRHFATAALAATVLVASVLGVLLATRSRSGPDEAVPEARGIPACLAEAAEDLLDASALQCWFPAPRGRWRTLSRVSAHRALLVEVEATDLRDAEEIARRFVDDADGRFAEILIYAEREREPPPRLIKRVQWTPRGGFQTLEFSSAPSP
jgi:hypothetical protein